MKHMRRVVYSLLPLAVVTFLVFPYAKPVLRTWWSAERLRESAHAAPQDAAPQAPGEKRVLESALAGSWYTGDPAALRAEIKGYSDKAEGPVLEHVQALILPHAGYRYSGQTAAYGIKQIAGKPFSRVIVMGPSHHAALENRVCVSDFTHYRTPLGEVPIDWAFVAALRQNELFQSVPSAERPEHSVQIEVPLLQEALGSFKLVPLVLGQLDAATARAAGERIASLIDEETLVIASSDFTHYGANYDFVPFTEKIEENLKKLDMGAVEQITAKDPEGFLRYVGNSGATICGRAPIAVLLSMLPGASAAHLLRYDTSGKLTNDFSMSVSYCAIAFTGKWPRGAKAEEAVKAVEAVKEPELTPQDKEALLAMARKTLEYVFEHRKAPTPKDLGMEVTAAMKPIRGAFVTLEEQGELRGCIGDIFGERPLYEAVIGNAINAAFRDYRFPTLEASELPRIEIEISALTPLRSVASFNEIEVGKHGVLLTKGSSRAVFLPQVAPEQGWDRDTMLNHLAQKAGLPQDAWRDGAKFEVFEAIVFGEKKP